MAVPLRSRAELRTDAEDAVLGLFVGFRAFGSPAIAAAAASLAWLDPTPWRRAALLSCGVLVVVFSVYERHRFRRVGPRAFVAPVDLLVVAVAQCVLVLASGGLASPFAPTLLLVAFFQGFWAPSSVRAWTVLPVQLPAVWAMAWLQAEGGLGSLRPLFLEGFLAPAGTGGGAYVFAAVLSIPLVVAPQVARRIRRRIERTYLDALTARDRSLALYAEQAETLTRLSGEIAHELKNPLASIKGLGALLAADATGRAQERLAVLRREADRMQRVLDEMLEFGRPLVPLDARAVDLRDLVREVVTVHEGMAAGRSVHLVLDAPTPAPAYGDPRKILQVLTNLVQNALEATPPGGHVVVRAGPGEVRVLDAGPGVDASVAGRAFEAGVTTKPQGTGLGLTIARTLARQHGGDLALGSREDGRRGAEAVLVLPVDASALVAGTEARPTLGAAALAEVEA